MSPKALWYLEGVFAAVGLLVFKVFIFVNHDFIGGIIGAIVGYTVLHIVLYLIGIIKKQREKS
jgi:hypothetical protein